MARERNLGGATNSWLFTPATRPDRFQKALDAGSDVLIVDLEDAVAPADKDEAREIVATVLSNTSSIASSRSDALAIRINSPRSVDGHKDIALLLESPLAPKYVLVPKVEAAESISALSSLFREAGKAISIVPLIESAVGITSVREIATADPSVIALMFGAADYASDVSAQPESLALQFARCQVAAACVSSSILAIDAPCFSIHDSAKLAADLRFAIDNGFRAKAAIHPAHISDINRSFMPTPERVEWAERVLDAASRGVAVVDGRMVDEAIAREARQVLASVR
jgi:(S)-citramalyl-CoA lyase